MPETPTAATAGAGPAAHVLPGCGHLLELDCPGQANQYLAGFLARG